LSVHPEGEEAVTTSGNEEDEEEGALSEDIEDEEAEPKKAPAVENSKAAAKINENGNASTCDMTLNTTADELAAEVGGGYCVVMTILLCTTDRWLLWYRKFVVRHLSF